MDMNKILQNMDSAEKGTYEASKQDRSEMKTILESFYDVAEQDAAPQQLDEIASVTMSGDSADEVAQLVKLMNDAGAPEAAPVGAQPVSMPEPVSVDGPPDMPPKADMVTPKMMDDFESAEVIQDEYANEPDATYSDHETMTHDLSGGLNRRKGAYADAEDGDNPMAVESKLREELSKMLKQKMSEKKDQDKDGDNDFDDVKIARMKASGMSHEEAVAKVKGDSDTNEDTDMSEDDDPCWKNYKMVGTKKKNGKEVPNCVPKESATESSKKKEVNEASSLKLVKKLENKNRSVKIYKDSEYNEFVVKHYEDGQYQDQADYFDDDKQSAMDTAKAFLKGATDTNESDLEEMDYDSFHNDENLENLRTAIDRNQIVSVAFVKKDGSVRQMAIKKNLESYVPSTRPKSDAQANVQQNNNIKKVVDINAYNKALRELKQQGMEESEAKANAAKKSWRSINLGNVLGFSIGGQFIDLRDENEIMDRFGEEVYNSLSKTMQKSLDANQQNNESEFMEAHKDMQEAGKSSGTFDYNDIFKLQKMDLESAKEYLTDIVQNSRMSPRKIQYHTRAVERARSVNDLLSLFTNLVLSGEGLGTVGSGTSMSKSDYRQMYDSVNHVKENLHNIPPEKREQIMQLLKRFSAGKISSQELQSQIDQLFDKQPMEAKSQTASRNPTHRDLAALATSGAGGKHRDKSKYTRKDKHKKMPMESAPVFERYVKPFLNKQPRQLVEFFDSQTRQIIHRLSQERHTLAGQNKPTAAHDTVIGKLRENLDVLESKKN